MVISVNTNPEALVALQNLNSTEQQLAIAQNQVSTGLAVSDAQDNGAIFAIAQNQRATSSALTAVTQSLQRVQSTVNVASTAGATVSDLLNQLKAATLSAADTSTNTTSRLALNATFTSLLQEIKSVVTNASFNSINLIDGSVANLAALASTDGTSKLTVNAQSLALGGINITVPATASITTVTLAQNVLTLVNASVINVNDALAKLGASANALQTQITFTGTLQDTIDTGIGNLVNANLAKESATLTALQTKQQLGIQSLSIANSSSQTLLSLFR
ncbi:MAG TPA: flagellin [Caulobacteraceae bacterium]|jgi:flagellin|nr:flagellin [Caulobacteraceae bacterium]